MKKFRFLIIFLCLVIFLGCNGEEIVERVISYPDLTIISVMLNQNCFIKVVVKNVGEGELLGDVYTFPQPDSAGIYIYINGKAWGGETIMGFDTARNLQKPGGEATCILTYKVGSNPLSVRAVVDLHNTVKESNEDNNEMEVTLSCQ